MWEEALLVGVGAASALSGQALAHILAIKRERRRDLAATLDKAVGAFARGEGLLVEVIYQAERLTVRPDHVFSGYPESVHAALAEAADRGLTEMRAALFSIRVRVQDPETPVHAAFATALDEWQRGYTVMSVAIEKQVFARQSFRAAHEHLAKFRDFHLMALERAAADLT